MLFKKTKQLIADNHCKRKGSILMFVLVFGAVASMMIISGVASYAIFENKASNRKHNRDLAFQIAEAGVNYYKWHLAHSPTDYWDGTGGQPGPYQHDYEDKNGTIIGYYSLEIDEPLAGSSVVVMRSTGWTVAEPETKRTLQVRLGFAALTDYTFLSNANMNFSFTTDVHGTVHSNGGIRFDGTTDSWVKSAKETYTYLNQTHKGVWGAGGPKSFWQYPVPWIDFFAVTSDLSNISDMADESNTHYTSSGKEGWHIVFTGTTYKLYKVTSRECHYGEGSWKYKKKTGWYWVGSTYCYDIGAEQLVGTYSIPTTGAIFVEDDVWIEGTVDGRVSVGVGKFPVQEPYKTAYISNNLLYTEKSSDDVIGILAQGNVVVPYDVPDDMEINAAMLSQFGQLYRPYYYDDLKDDLTIFGSQISYQGGGWKYVNGWGNVVSGFVDTHHVYDGNLKYYPPPGFPVGTVYDLISWEEL
ncbi:MAG: hypothetical protein HY569_02600 [Candidatus Magasanikbacteria bacterium]|nr:hypothetical protein [Candidatus Magasanikbacteria bacterium]